MKFRNFGKKSLTELEELVMLERFKFWNGFIKV